MIHFIPSDYMASAEKHNKCFPASEKGTERGASIYSVCYDGNLNYAVEAQDKRDEHALPKWLWWAILVLYALPLIFDGGGDFVECVSLQCLCRAYNVSKHLKPVLNADICSYMCCIGFYSATMNKFSFLFNPQKRDISLFSNSVHWKGFFELLISF